MRTLPCCEGEVVFIVKIIISLLILQKSFHPYIFWPRSHFLSPTPPDPHPLFFPTFRRAIFSRTNFMPGKVQNLINLREYGAPAPKF